MIARQPSDIARPNAAGIRWARMSPLVLFALDGVLTYCAFIVAYWLRYSLRVGPAIQDQISFSSYQPLALMLLAIMIPVMVIKGAYRIRMGRELVDEAILVFSATTISVASVVVITSMAHQYLYSRGVVVYVWVLVIVLVVSGRSLIRAVQSACHRRGIATRKVVVVGATDTAMMAMQRMQDRPDFGLQLEGFVYPNGSPNIRNFGRFRALGAVDSLPRLLESRQVDEVIVALPSSAHEEMWPILDLCERTGVDLKIIPDLFEMSFSRVQVDDIGGIPLFEVRERPTKRASRLVKRAVDLVVGGGLFLLTLPVFAVLWVLIRMESRGPALLRQVRVGLGGENFVFYKFRTMRSDADELRESLEHLNDTDGPLFKMRDDPRCTPIGRRIRQWSLDEIPNVLNVLKGEMSVVGPRPPLPLEVARYDAKLMRRLEVKPGMTGIWQVSGRSDLPFDEMLMMDIYYVENWSLALDVKIMLRTVRAVLSRHGAY